MANRQENVMTSALNPIVAYEHIADLQRQAARYRAARPGSAEVQVRPIELRLVQSGQDAAASQLAALDDAAELEGPALIAFMDGEPVAATSLTDGRVVADPFVATADAVSLLRLRAEHLAGRPSHRSLRSILRLRLRLAA
jgi:hypothetical protein